MTKPDIKCPRLESIQTLDQYLNLAEKQLSDKQLSSHNIDEAYITLSQARQHYPNDAANDHRFNLFYGIVLCKVTCEREIHSNNIQLALEYFQKAVKLDKNYESYHKIAKTLDDINQKKCLNYYDAAYKMKPHEVLKYAKKCIRYVEFCENDEQKLELLKKSQDSFNKYLKNFSQANKVGYSKLIHDAEQNIDEIQVRMIILQLNDDKIERNSLYVELENKADILPNNNEYKKYAYDILYKNSPEDLAYFKKYTLILETKNLFEAQQVFNDNTSNPNPEIKEISVNKLNEFFAQKFSIPNKPDSMETQRPKLERNQKDNSCHSPNKEEDESRAHYNYLGKIMNSKKLSNTKNISKNFQNRIVLSLQTLRLGRFKIDDSNSANPSLHNAISGSIKEIELLHVKQPNDRKKALFNSNKEISR